MVADLLIMSAATELTFSWTNVWRLLLHRLNLIRMHLLAARRTLSGTKRRHKENNRDNGEVDRNQAKKSATIRLRSGRGNR